MRVKRGEGLSLRRARRGQRLLQAHGGFQRAFHVAAAMQGGLAGAEMQSTAEPAARQRGVAVFGLAGGLGLIERRAGIRLVGPVVEMQFTLIGGFTKQLHQLAAHQHRHTHLELRALFRRHGAKTTERCAVQAGIGAAAGIENLTQHRLFVAHEGIAGMAVFAPEGLRVDHQRLGLRGHPGGRGAHRLDLFRIERGCEAHTFEQQTRRHGQHHTTRADHGFCRANFAAYFSSTAAETQFEIRAHVGHCNQFMRQPDGLRWQAAG